MRESKGMKKHGVFVLLTLGCVLVDVGLFLAVGLGLQWLAEATSPWLLAGLAALVVLIVRIARSVQSARILTARS